MKKTVSLLLAVLLLAGVLASCGSASQPAPAPANTDPVPVSPSPAPVDPTPSYAPLPPEQEIVYSPEGSVIFNKDGVKVTTAGLDLDPTEEPAHPIIWVDVENTGSKDVCLGVAEGSVNGFMTDAVLIEFYEEDGAHFGGDYSFSVFLSSGYSDRYALSYYKQDAPGVDMDTLERLEFAFTTAPDTESWPDYVSDRVVIATGETADSEDVPSLGTVLIDNDDLLLVAGEQAYSDWFGPQVYLYALNRSDRYMGLYCGTAAADGVNCDDPYFSVNAAPGKWAVSQLSFDGEARALRGFERLDLDLVFCQADTMDGVNSPSTPQVSLDTVSVTYPPQIWGDYENGGLKLEVQPKYNDLITVKTPENDPEGVLFSVSETASLQAADYEGSGWLFSIRRVSEERMHEMVCESLNEDYFFASDEEGNYYLFSQPSDVRMERATAAEMEAGMEQWSMLCAWAAGQAESFQQKNGLTLESFGNSAVNIYMARAAFRPGTRVVLTADEFGSVEADTALSAPYAQFVQEGAFWEATPEETPEGDVLSVRLPDEDVQLDFFYADPDYIRVTEGGVETLYAAMWSDDSVTYTEAAEGWYYAAAEQAGVKPKDTRLEAYYGLWYEQIAGRAELDIQWCPAPGKVRIRATWPDGYAVMHTWNLTASLEEARLVYEGGLWEKIEFDESGEGWTSDTDWDQSGWFFLNEKGGLVWHNDDMEYDEDPVFVR